MVVALTKLEHVKIFFIQKCISILDRVKRRYPRATRIYLNVAPIVSAATSFYTAALFLAAAALIPVSLAVIGFDVILAAFQAILQSVANWLAAILAPMLDWVLKRLDFITKLLGSFTLLKTAYGLFVFAVFGITSEKRAIMCHALKSSSTLLLFSTYCGLLIVALVSEGSAENVALACDFFLWQCGLFLFYVGMLLIFFKITSERMRHEAYRTAYGSGI